jgi:hypothetical protein
MRVLFGCLAVLLGGVSIALAARYGYKGTDTVVDGTISAVVFGAIALCACLFDAAAVRLWFMGHRIGSVVIGIIAAAALVVTFTNSLGAIASRADTTQAERSRAKSSGADDRAALERAVRERAGLAFTPVTADAAQAAQEAVGAAERIRQAECGNGDPRQRGPNCRARETDEQAKRDALSSLLTHKAATDRAMKLDQDIAEIRARLTQASPVENPNPLGATMALMIGAAADALTAWQQAVVAGVFELCLVGVMVIYELLGHRKVDLKLPTLSGDTRRGAGQQSDGRGVSIEVAPTASRRLRGAVKTRGSGQHHVRTFFRERVLSEQGARAEMKALTRDIRAWGSDNGLELPKINQLLDDVGTVCRERGIEIEVGDDQRVYCLGIKLARIAVPG